MIIRGFIISEGCSLTIPKSIQRTEPLVATPNKKVRIRKKILPPYKKLVRGRNILYSIWENSKKIDKANKPKIN